MLPFFHPCRGISGGGRERAPPGRSRGALQTSHNFETFNFLRFIFRFQCRRRSRVVVLFSSLHPARLVYFVLVPGMLVRLICQGKHAKQDVIQRRRIVRSFCKCSASATFKFRVASDASLLGCVRKLESGLWVRRCVVFGGWRCVRGF